MLSQQIPIEIGRVPQVRLTCPGVPWGVPGPTTICFECFPYPTLDFPVGIAKAIVRTTPIFFGSRTPHGTPGQVWRTWGTRHDTGCRGERSNRRTAFLRHRARALRRLVALDRHRAGDL